MSNTSCDKKKQYPAGSYENVWSIDKITECLAWRYLFDHGL